MIFKSNKMVFGLLVLIFIFYSYDYPKEAFDNFLKKNNLKQYTDYATSNLNILKTKLIKDTKTYIANSAKNNINNEYENESQGDQNNLKNSGQETDLFCNKKYDSNKLQNIKYLCALNDKDKSVSFLKPINQIPYNYTDKLDNNVLYSLTPSYLSQKIKHEKEIKNSVIPYNSKIIHSNFDKNIDNYKKSRQVNTILNVKRKNEDYKPCFAKTPENIQKELKLFTRILRNDIVINWNIPILPKGYMPKEIIIQISKYENFKKPEIYSIDYTESACNFENHLFKITTFKREDRIVFNLTTTKDQWFSRKRKCFILSSKVFFTFEFFDENRILQECLIESNTSKFIKN
jgi:hypothetical protein